MTQLPFVIGSDTSKAAAQSQVDKFGGDEALVLAEIRARGAHGATDDEVERALGMSHQTASARRNGLVRKGFVCDSGLRRLTRSGRKAAVWVPGNGVPLEGAPNHRVPRPSNEEIRAALRIMQPRGLSVSTHAEHSHDKLVAWLTDISK